MGTHPIFESDFDCLTDMAKGKKGKKGKNDEDAQWDELEKKQANAQKDLEQKMGDLSTGEPQMSKSQMKKNKRNKKKAAKGGFADLVDDDEDADSGDDNATSSPVPATNGKKGGFAALDDDSEDEPEVESEEEIQIKPK